MALFIHTIPGAGSPISLMMRTAIIPARFRSVILGLRLFVTGILLPGPRMGQCDGVKATDRFAIPPYAMAYFPTD